MKYELSAGHTCLAALCLALHLDVRLAVAATVAVDFNTNPTGLLTVFRAGGGGNWRPTGGVAGSGYFSLTDAVTNQSGVIGFNDLDRGATVQSFTFSADIRLGGGGVSGFEAPGEGLSICFALEGDPVITTGAAFHPGRSSAAEEGTTTGIAVCFDEAANGTNDMVGISVRVENEIVFSKLYPVIIGSASDRRSLQTGPYGVPLNASFDVVGHSFVPVSINMTENGRLNLWFKGEQILTNFPTSFLPSRGRFVLGARTIGPSAFSHHHIDNISITTTPATQPLLTQLSGMASGFRAVLSEGTTATIRSGTVTAFLNAATSPLPVSITSSGLETLIRYEVVPPNWLRSASSNMLRLDFADSRGVLHSITRSFVVSPYQVLNPGYTNPFPDLAFRVFSGRVSQILTSRFPGNPNSVVNMERQLWDGYIDSETGHPFVNQASPNEFDGMDLINWLRPGSTNTGFFDANNGYPDSTVPGVASSTSAVAVVIYGYLNLPAGTYRLGVMSEESFRLTTQRNPRDVLGDVLGSSAGSPAGALFDVVAPVAGIYPVRLAAWWDRVPRASLEFFVVDVETEQKFLLNDPTAPIFLEVLSEGPLNGTFPYVRKAVPLRDQREVSPHTPILLELVDGTVGSDIVDSSIVMSLDGSPVAPSVTREQEIVTVFLASKGALSVGKHTLTLSFSDAAAGTNSYVWEFFVIDPNLENMVTLSTDGILPDASAGYTGFRWLTYQLAPVNSGATLPNVIEAAESGLAGLFTGLTFGTNAANLGDFGADGYFHRLGPINFNLNGARERVGSFGDDASIPGIPGANGSTNNFIVEVLTWMRFPTAGIYRMGINSNPGFRLTQGHNRPRHALIINSPSSIAGPVGCVPSQVIYVSLNATDANRGIGAPLPTTPLTGEVVSANPIAPCNALINNPAVAGKIALVDRTAFGSAGCLSFVSAVVNAQASGAIAVIVIYDTQPGIPLMVGNPGGVTIPDVQWGEITIPALLIGNPDGGRIKAALSAGPVVASISQDSAPRLGEFSSRRPASDSIFSFYVPAPGLYPLRLMSWNGRNTDGLPGIEWFSIHEDRYGNCSKVLINSAHPQALRAFRIPVFISINREPTGGVIINFTGTLQASPAVTGPFADVDGAASPYRVPASLAPAQFYRVRN